jgi:DNA-directed RNA polymerase specialized sigma24 family protein
MLGSVADAEDVVQDAFIRWLGTDRDAVREPAAFLRRTVTRLCLDQIKSARNSRETYTSAPGSPTRWSRRRKRMMLRCR